MAGVASVVIAVIGLFVVNSGDDGSDPGGNDSAAGDEPTHYFMYGTMMPGHLRYPAIDDFVVSTASDSVPGSLYDTGAGYPAAKFGEGDGQIQGVLLEIVPEREVEAATVIADLEGNLFRPVTVETDSGTSAIAYEYIGSTDGMAPIPDGVWDGQEA